CELESDLPPSDIADDSALVREPVTEVERDVSPGGGVGHEGSPPGVRTENIEGERPAAMPWTDHHHPFVAHTAQDVAWSWQTSAAHNGRRSGPAALAKPEAEWPSARELIESHRGLPAVEATDPSSRAPQERGSKRPAPTVATAPAEWSLPAWAGVGPVAA